jgi:DNA-binding beta-propeller fold protein YncE
MALDEDGHRLFVVTRRPPLVVVLDTDSGKEVARVPVGGSSDDVYFDAERKRIYVIAGEGFINVVQQNDPNHYTVSASLPTAVGVRTGVFFGLSLYVGVPASGSEPAQIWNYAVPE